MDRKELGRYIRDVIGNKDDDLYWFNIADWHIAEIKKAKAEVADEIITMIETYDTNDLATVASLFKYAIALKQQVKK